MLAVAVLTLSTKSASEFLNDLASLFYSKCYKINNSFRRSSELGNSIVHPLHREN